MNSTLESDFVKAILVALSKRKDVRVWRQNSGKSVVVDPHTGRKRSMQMAPTGAADISGIHIRTGQRVEIECKAAGNRPSAAQKRWRKFIESFHGIYVLAAHDEKRTMKENVDTVVSDFETSVEWSEVFRP